MTQKRNGEIDVLRFVCAVGIAVHHFNDLFPADLMYHGYAFVKFFFLVSGYFMMHSIAKLDPQPMSGARLANTTWAFLLRKLRSFYPYYLFAVMLEFVVSQAVYGFTGLRSIAAMFLESIPYFTLTFFGLNVHEALYLGGSWYLSVMMICLLILFPIALRWRESAAKLLFPVVSLFLLGYLNTTYGTVSAQANWTGFCASGILQGLAQISLGACLYPLAQYLRTHAQWQAAANSRAGKVLFTVLKLACYGAVLSSAQSASIDDLNTLLVMAAGLLLCLSGSGCTLPETRVTRYLGRISLPIYLFHGILRYPLQSALSFLTVTPALCLGLAGANVLLSVALMYCTDFVRKGLRSVCKKAFSI